LVVGAVVNVWCDIFSHERLGPVLHTCHVHAVRLCGEAMPAQHKTKQLEQLGIKTHARMHQAS